MESVKKKLKKRKGHNVSRGRSDYFKS